MIKRKFSIHEQTTLRRLLFAAKAARRQIGVVAVAAALGLAVVLNVAMAPVTNADNALSQVAYLKKDIAGKLTAIR